MPQHTLKEGRWRVCLHTDTGADIPFSLEIFKNDLQYQAYIINGAEKILLEDITLQEDNVHIPLHIFDAALVGKVEGNTIKGVFRKYYALDKDQAFTAKHDQDFRFPIKDIYPSADLSGQWSVTFQKKDGTTHQAIALFVQKNEKVTGTFMTNTGDYRFLEGVMQGNILRLSAFDGNHAFLFVAQLKDNTLKGKFMSGTTHSETWEAQRNDTIQLEDPFEMTSLRDGFDTLSFALPNLDGNLVSLKDARFENKAVIVQLSASWCPNCMDQTAFLSSWYNDYLEQCNKTHQNPEIEILSLAFERQDNFEYAKKWVQKVVKRYNIQYPILIAGTSDKTEASKVLPMLSPIRSFPTTIFIDKAGKVRKIHTGFNGPATMTYFEEWSASFETVVSEILK